MSTIVQFKSNVSFDRSRRDVSRVSGHVFGQLHIIHALAVKLTAERAQRLAANPDVHDGDLPDFQTSNGSGSRVVETAMANPNATTVSDMYGHGTDMAGIIAGNGLNRSPSDPLYGQYVGVAPNANLISIKASDDPGNATVLVVIYGLLFAVDHQSDYNIRVVNLSLDSTTAQSYTTDPDKDIIAPMISGLVADMLQYRPYLTPNQVKGALLTPWISDNSSIQIPDAVKVSLLSNVQPANRGLTPNTLIINTNGDIDYTRSSWSRSSWSTATGSLSAAFARSSWSCNCEVTSGGTTDPSRSNWSRSSWSTYFSPDGS